MEKSPGNLPDEGEQGTNKQTINDTHEQVKISQHQEKKQISEPTCLALVPMTMFVVRNSDHVPGNRLMRSRLTADSYGK